MKLGSMVYGSAAAAVLGLATPTPATAVDVPVGSSAVTLGVTPCESDEECDDGVFCNGVESCDLGSGQCVAVSACPPFVDGCVTRNAICDEEGDRCLDQPDDSLCDDGVFCNGVESCIVETGECGAASACPPSVEVCVVRNAICDEEDDRCLDQQDDSFCPEGEVCLPSDECAFPTCGDVNASGVVNVGDALLVSQFDVHLRECGLPPFDAAQNCDIAPPPSGDGTCNIADALRMAQCDAELISCGFLCSPFSCPEPSAAR
jgi:hypothetical protein